MNNHHRFQYYYTRLPTAEQDLYRVIYDGFRQKINTIPLKPNGKQGIDVCMKVIDAILRDHPDIFYVNTRRVELQSSGTAASLIIHYVYDKYKTADLARELDIRARSVLNSVIPGQLTDFEKELRIHDYLMNNVDYNMGADLSGYENYTAAGVILNRKGVCESFAKGAKLLLDMAGIKNIIVTGTANNFMNMASVNHAWNMVNIDGHYQHLDTTWDNTMKKSSGLTRHDYFNLSDDDAGKDHAWAKETVPVCPDSPHNYHYYHQAIVSDQRNLTDYIRKNIEGKVPEFSFKIINNSHFSREYPSVLEECIRTALWEGRGNQFTRYVYSVNTNQRVCCLKFQ